MAISEKSLDQVQDSVSLVDIIESRNIDIKKAGQEYKAVCPFHGDKDASLFVNDRVGHCFGCGWKGNVFQFMMEYDSIDFVQAVKECARIGKIKLEHIDISELQVEHEISERNHKILHEASAYWKRCFWSNKGKAARNYWNGRGIDDGISHEYGVGYDDGGLFDYLVTEKKFKPKTLRSLQLFNAKNNCRFHGRIVVPIESNGKIVNIYGRSLDAKSSIPHLYLRQKEGAFNIDKARQHKVLWTVEAIIDAMVMISRGTENVIAQLGAEGLQEQHITALKRSGVTDITHIPDHDLPKKGSKSPESFFSAGRAISKILNHGISARIALIPTEGQDPADYFTSGGTLRGLKIKDPLRWGSEHSTTKNVLLARRLSTLGAGPDKSKEFELECGGNTWCLEKTTYGSSGLKGLLTVRDRSGGILYKDRADLWSAPKRKAMAKDLSMDDRIITKVCDIMESQCALLTALDKAERKSRKLAAGGSKLPSYADELAESLRNSDDIITDIIRDVSKLGYVGEEANKALLYLIGVSSMMSEPLGCFIASESGAGKSAMVEVISSMFPPDLIFDISRMTDQALYYVGEDELMHRWLIVAERHGSSASEAGDYNLRTFFSEKKLTLLRPIKDEATGRIEANRLTVKGPIAYTETTTELDIHAENASRLLEINIRETIEQTAAVHDFQKKMASLTNEQKSEIEKSRKRIMMKHRAFIGSLKPLEIRVPYAQHIEFPTHLPRARRDLLKYLGIIKVIAFLNQHKRKIKEVDGVGYIEADMSDYESAYDIARDSVRKAFSDVPERSQELLSDIFDALKDQATGEVDIDDPELSHFTIRELREAGIKKSPATIRRYLVPLVEQDLLEIIEEGTRGRGNASIYRIKVSTLAEASDPISASITTPDQLVKKVSGESDTDGAWDGFFGDE